MPRPLTLPLLQLNLRVAKESTHRADELKAAGWSNDDVNRYAELWDYRQRWGAINLEREDRQFLRKAESALPKIQTGKASVKKPISEKSYYRWLRFYLEAMDHAEKNFNLKKGDRGKWPIVLEEEIRALDYYQPVLGLPDTLKAKNISSFREEVIGRDSIISDDQVSKYDFDFQAPLVALKAKESTKWRYLRDGENLENKTYQVLDSYAVETFRKQVRVEIVPLIRETLPSLADTDKPEPSDEWIHT